MNEEKTVPIIRRYKRMIRTKELVKDYGNGRGIQGLSLQISERECFGLLGPNGAGKTTLIRLLMGFLRPDGGQAYISGMDCWKDSADIRAFVGFMPVSPTFSDPVTGRGFLRTLAEIWQIKEWSEVEALADRFSVDLSVPVRNMSLGTKRKLSAITALMHDPKILILDEPMLGLDPLVQQVFINLLQEKKAAGTTILFSSHSFYELSFLCDRVGILKDGNIARYLDLSEHADKEVYERAAWIEKGFKTVYGE